MSVFRGQLMKWDYGKQVQHKPKNRYGNLLPYDHSRVVLDIIDGDSNTDYINANFVDGYKCNNRYVATQGPLPSTINDMWRMIWQLDSHQIVMLTSLDEGGKNKCDKYWTEQVTTYGNIKLTLTKTEIFADYIIRSFSAEKDGVVREIVQYHFISWPDHTVPMYSCSLLTFIRRMRSSVHYKPSQPIVVHCSAGVGRTGTFILIDAMLEMAQNEKQIDVLKHFCVIRQQRINLVEKLGQYVFVHQALLEALSHEPTSIACNDFHNYFTKLINYDNNNKSLPLLKQFQILNKLSPQVMSPELCQSARAHPHLNRNQDIIPPDFARVILPGSDDYINAVYINGYKRRDAYIVTQVPLESSRSHFWQMIASTSTKTIVLLNDIKHDNQIYWPTMSNKQLDFSDNKQTVQLISEENHNNMTIRVFHLPQNDTTVKQFHLKGWPSMVNKPSSAQIVIDLMEMMESWNLQSNANSIVVQCFDGNQASGVFCATSFECDRIKEEQEVDVFLAVQTVRTNRPQFITDLKASSTPIRVLVLYYYLLVIEVELVRVGTIKVDVSHCSREFFRKHRVWLVAYKITKDISSRDDDIKDSIRSWFKAPTPDIVNKYRKQMNTTTVIFDGLEPKFKYKLGIVLGNEQGDIDLYEIYLDKNVTSVDSKVSDLELILIIVLAILLFITFILLGILLY
ncbi:unnamed protein product, partial [Oppiella nova]